MSRMFGTDGVRGIANSPELSPELAYRLGRAGAYLLTQPSTVVVGDARPRMVVGMDTRASGEMLEAALVAGVCSVGVDAVRVGVVTTPAVAYLTSALGAQGGVMISASHNPAEYNGIKFFGATGHKLPDAAEDRIEAIVRDTEDNLPNPTGSGVGRVTEQPETVEAYIQHVVAAVAGSKAAGARPWQGLKLVVDCANGAAYHLASEVYRRLGAEVVSLFDQPDGLNINADCGSTHPEHMQSVVRNLAAQVGIAHDGDADRVILADENGDLVDGDHMLAICGLDLLQKGRLPGNGVVATVLSNMGLELALNQAGGRLVRTKVGDRYVLEGMMEQGLVLGGEQSGHVIFLEHSTTGDGILTACQVIKTVVESGKPLSVLASQMENLPQIMVNVPVTQRDEALTNPRIQAAVARAEKALQGEGRVLVRPSGTEPLVRIMAEGRDETKLHRVASELEEVIRAELA